MRTGWQRAKLGDVCEIYQPKTISAKEMSPDGAYTVFGANGIIGRYHQYNHETPQLLVTCRGATCGSVNISLPYSWVTGNAMVVRPKTHQLSMEYLAYAFRGVVDFSKVITGAAQPQITRQSLAPVEIAYPPLDEQKRIVAILDEAFEGLDRAAANAKKNLANARELFASYRAQNFDGLMKDANRVLLGQVCDFENGDRGKNYPGKEHRVPAGVPFMNAGHLTEDGLDHSTMDFISPERFALLGNGKIRPNDVLFCLRGSLGKFAALGELSQGAIASSLVILRPHNELRLQYLLQYLASHACAAMIKKFAGGAAQPNLGAKDLRNFVLPLPSLTQQDRIAERLETMGAEVRSLRELYEKKIADVAALRQSILQKAFVGEITGRMDLAA